jgi:hypothetical protein
VPDEPVIFVAREVPDVGRRAGEKVVDRDDAMTFRQQAVREMRAEKTGAAGHHGDRRGGRTFEHDATLPESALGEKPDSLKKTARYQAQRFST